MVSAKAWIGSISSIAYYWLAAISSVQIGSASSSGVESCRETFTKTRIIRSPNYPLAYPSKFACDYIFNASQSGPKNLSRAINTTRPPERTLEPRWAVSFINFQLEYSSNCSRDYLRVSDLTERRLIGQYCGPRWHTPHLLVSSGPQLKIHFQTDESYTQSGFEIGVRLLDTPALISEYRVLARNRSMTWSRKTPAKRSLYAELYEKYSFVVILLLLAVAFAASVCSYVTYRRGASSGSEHGFVEPEYVRTDDNAARPAEHESFIKM